MATKTSYEELKSQLSAEKSKPKSERDNKWLKSLHSQMNDHKKRLHVEFEKRMKQNHKEEVAIRLKLEKKRIARNKKIRNMVMAPVPAKNPAESKLNGKDKKKK